MAKKNLVGRGATGQAVTVLYSNTTVMPTFIPGFTILDGRYSDSVTFVSSLWAATTPGEDPDGWLWKSTITASAVEGSNWPVGYDIPIIVEVTSNVEGTVIASTFTIILDATTPSFTVSPAVVELAYTA